MEEHLRAKSLRADTTAMGETIKDLDEIIEFKDGQLADKGTIVDTQKKDILDQKKAVKDLSEKNAKQDKKINRLKSVCWVSILLNAILAIAIIITK